MAENSIDRRMVDFFYEITNPQGETQIVSYDEESDNKKSNSKKEKPRQIE
jgi:hypothetical protein